MRKLPASEQPTQLTVRDVTADPIVARPYRRFSALSWIAALMVVMSVCAVAGFGAALAVRQIYISLDAADNITYEVVERKEPVTVAATTGEAISKAPLSPVFSPEVQFWAPLIAEWALAWEIDPNLIATV
ncbi:MAG TPA: hypothetical protein VJZ27_17255, partial [Aggregatilineales bacterium]|nr:hypothetical protein [Aggregatilineales bacterium]